MDDTMMSTVLERIEHADLEQEVEMQILAACEGLLDELLDEGDYEPPTVQPVSHVEPPGVYLGSLTVEGFRGIGERRKLPLTPGPGLTLVVGRNGSGKSSFAEAAEMLFTGANRRWEGRPKDWQHGWRNLHQSDLCQISAELSIDGVKGPVRLARNWSPDDELDGAHAVVRTPQQSDRPIEALSWDRALDEYRPFLSYNELGSMLEGKPSELYDAMWSILGLEDLDAAVKALGEAKRALARRRRDAKNALQPLLDQLAASEDERAARCNAALSGRSWDLDSVDEVLLADELDADAGGVIATLRGLASLQRPSAEDVEKVTAELIEARADLDELAGTDADRADAIAQVLGAAIRAHDAHGDQACPVCGSGRLDAAWHATAAEHVAQLRREATDARDAQARLRAAVRAADDLAGDPPTVLLEGQRADVDTRGAVAAWRSFATLPDAAIDIAAHLEQHHPILLAATDQVCTAATAELDRRNAEWVPLARALNRWSADAREAVDAARQAKRLQTGEQWLKDTTATLRDERFRPIAEQAQALWEQLRQQSSVNLDDIVLAGASTRRRLELSVSVDGSDSSALGVMSQGELHALALSLFLPRATLPASPFRFLVIDDPVQSMDPARVDGLAKVLDRVAQERQVVVFTHDDRLPESMRRLNVDARVIGVVRQSQSRVEVREQLEPVTRNLDDARVLAMTDDVPGVIVANVVPGLCRTAVEAACVEAVRRRRLARGESHADVEQAIGELRTTFDFAAVALFDDPRRGGDVFPRVNRWGHRLGDVLRWCKEGAHGAATSQHRGTLIANVDATRELANRLRAQR